MDREQVLRELAQSILDGSADIEYDSSGQLMVYSCKFKHSDGMFYDVSEEE